MANWDKNRSEGETTKITLAALAEKYDIKFGMLKSRLRKRRDADRSGITFAIDTIRDIERSNQMEVKVTAWRNHTLYMSFRGAQQ